MDAQKLLEESIASHQAGDLNAAERGYARLLEAKPGHPRVTYLMGALRGQQGRQYEALELLERAATALPREAAIRLHIGNALQSLTRFDQAIDSYGEALALNPDYGEALNNRGNALRALQQYDAALADFDAALALSPGNPGFWYNRGNLFLEQMQLAQAVENYDRALALRPDYPEAHNNKGSALRGLGQYDRAQASFEAALRLEPDNSEFRMNRDGTLLDLKTED